MIKRLFRKARDAPPGPMLRLLGLALLLSAGWLGATSPASAASGSIALTVRPIIPDSASSPAAVTDLTAATNPAVEGEVLLSWTAPDGNTPASGQRVAGYLVRMATFSVDDLAGDTTAWWSIASTAPAIAPAPQIPGTLEFMTIPGLEPGATFYFAVRSTDTTALISTIDVRAEAGGAPQAFALIPDLQPVAPANLTLSRDVTSIQVSWDPVSAADLDFYRVHVDSIPPYDFADQFLITVDSTSTSLTHSGLTQATSYTYFVTAVDKGTPTFAGLALESDPSAIVSTVTLRTGMRPMAPMGVIVAAAGATVTLGWSPTVRFEDGTLFQSTTTPTTDELIGYSLFRSTEACVPDFVHVASLPYVTTALVNATGGLNYYYRIFSYNSFGVSSNTLTVSSLGERGFFADCNNMLTMDAGGAVALNAATNGRGADILISSRRRPQDLGGPIFQSVEWRALLDGVTELAGFTLPKPARIVLRSDTQGGKDMGMYWFNGGEFKKMYGKVDSAARTVTVDSPNLGVYQIRALLRAAGAVFDLSNVSNRAITPNGDGLNDRVIFTYDPGPNNAAVTGRIYDLMGGLIADMSAGLVPNTLVWDGRSNGRAVSGGVYIYKIAGDGKIYTGTVVIAR